MKSSGQKAHHIKNLRVALLADKLTSACLIPEVNIYQATSLNFKLLLQLFKPDFVLAESAWCGPRNSWKYRVAAYADHPERNNQKLRKFVAYARDLGIPTVFWNREDGVHFDRFIDSAKLFDHVFTVDSNCVPRYKAIMGPQASVHTLMFAVQPALHSFKGFNFKHHQANFVGSYSRHIHDSRRAWQDMALSAACSSGLGATVFDRNSGRKAAHYRYPDFPGLTVLPTVAYAKTAQIYRDYLVSLNVNTVEDSPTMFSRRLVEILACGGIAVTSPAHSVDALFKDYCHVIATAEEAQELFARLKHGPSAQDLERARAGAEYVLREHTWAHRLQEIVCVVGLS